MDQEDPKTATGFTPNFIASRGQVVVNTGRSLFNTTDSGFFTRGKKPEHWDQRGSFLDKKVQEGACWAYTQGDCWVPSEGIPEEQDTP